MDSSTHQTKMYFDKFYRDMSRFAMNRILTTIGLLFIVISSVFLFASYLCLTGSNYIETFKNDYGLQCDYTDIQESLIDFIQSSKDTIYYYFGIIYNNDVFIKQEHMEEDSSDSDLEYSSDSDLEYSSDSDIEDVTEQILLEKEMNKIIVDLSEDIKTLELLNELGDNVVEDITAEIENTESDSEEANNEEANEDSNENSEDSNENSEEANNEEANEDSNENSEDSNENSEDSNEEESSQMVQRTLRSTKK